MSEFITINTDVAVKPQLKLEPLKVYTDEYPMLCDVMPEYDVSTLPNDSMSLLVSRMKLTMQQFFGVGLAANQCGVKSRVFVIGLGDDTFTCINPKIVKTYGDKVKKKEGCLSSPALFVNIPRYEEISVEFYDENGELKQMKFSGLTAQSFQHELDHLNGVKFTDGLGEVSMRLAKQKRDKLLKKYKRLK